MSLPYEFLGNVADYVKISESKLEKSASVIEYYKNRELQFREKVAQVVHNSDVQDYMKESLINVFCEDPTKFANFIMDKSSGLNGTRSPIGSSLPSGTSKSVNHPDPVEAWVFGDK